MKNITLVSILLLSLNCVFAMSNQITISPGNSITVTSGSETVVTCLGDATTLFCRCNYNISEARTHLEGKIGGSWETIERSERSKKLSSRYDHAGYCALLKVVHPECGQFLQSVGFESI